MTRTILGLALVSVTMSAFAQIAFKLGMSNDKADGVGQGLNILDTVIKAFNPFVLGGLALYALGTLFWLTVLRRADVSQAYPFVGLSFVLTVLIGIFFLGEPFQLNRLLGTALIVLGIILVAQ